LKLDKDDTRKNPCRTPIVYYNVLYVIVTPPILHLRKNSNSRVIQILIKRMRKQ